MSAEPKSGNRVKNEAALAKARIAVVKGTAQARNTAIQYPQAELAELADNQAIFDALIAGEVDAGVFTMLNKELADALNQAIKQGTVILSSYEVALPRRLRLRARAHEGQHGALPIPEPGHRPPPEERLAPQLL